MSDLVKFSRSVAGKVVLVTGAGSGMGAATAKVFASEDAKVIATDVNEEGLEAVASAIRDAGKEVLATRMDVSDTEEVRRVIEQGADHFGGLDIVVNNAGISLPAAIDADDFDEKWERCLSVLLTAHTRVIRAALPHLRRSETPRIVNIASTEGLGATAGNSPYSAAKTGVIGLTRSLALELGKEGINVNCICPGPIRTGMTERIPEEHKEIYARRRTALRRYGDPEEVAHATLSLCLPAASFVAGVALPVDGGLTIRRA